MIRRAFHLAGLACLFLLATSQALAGLPEAIVKLKPSVVLIGTFKATDSPRFQLRGTGFIVGNGQLVVTNAHVLPAPAVGDAPALVVQVRQGNDEWQMRPVQLLGQDLPRDLALLRMAGPPGPALAVGDSTRVREGDELAFMGFPIGGALGFSAVTHRALVASITPATLPSPTANNLQGQAIRGLRENRFDLFQLDAVAYPGNSGGPLFHPQTGEVLGVLNMVLVKSRRESVLSNPSGIAYAIPARHVRELMERHP